MQIKLKQLSLSILLSVLFLFVFLTPGYGGEFLLLYSNDLHGEMESCG